MTCAAHSTKVLKTPPPMRYGIVMVIQFVAPAQAKLGWDYALRPPHLIHDTAAAPPLSSSSSSSGPFSPPANARPADCAAKHLLLLLFQIRGKPTGELFFFKAPQMPESVAPPPWHQRMPTGKW